MRKDGIGQRLQPGAILIKTLFLLIKKRGDFLK